MCGIAGIWNSRGCKYDEINATLKLMIKELEHRGPDDRGFYIDNKKGIGFAHQRLSIQDLSSNGYQPMESKSGRYIIVFNGEIYNHLTLRKSLQNSGLITSEWRGNSDTETLLACIEAWGIKKALNKFNGMFSFVLLDKYLNSISLVRDRFGEKPLYYGLLNNNNNEEYFVFASELGAFKSLFKITKSIDKNALNSFFNFGYIKAPLSISNKLNQLLPGELIEINSSKDSLCFSKDNIKSHKWFNSKNLFSNQLKNNLPEQEILNQLENLIFSVVKEQSISDVPLGVFLSGGIDSSLIATALQKQSNKKISSFTISFPEDKSLKDFNEGIFSKRVSEYLGTNHKEIALTSNDIKDLIRKIPLIYSEPFADSSQLPTSLICSEAKKNGLSVVLTGDGGDEIFGGYNRHKLIPKINAYFGKMPRKINHFLSHIIYQLIKVNKNEFDSQKIYKLSKAIRFAKDPNEIYNSLISIWPKNEIPLKENYKVFSQTNIDNFNNNIYDNLILSDINNYLPNDILVKVDRASMYSSLETRAPFLDYRIADFACSLPKKYKIREKNKWALRQILYKHIPRELVDRPKQGFSLPIGTWLRGPLKKWAEELIDRDLIKSQGFLDYKIVEKYWQELLEGNTFHNSKIWSIIVWQSWLLEWS